MLLFGLNVLALLWHSPKLYLRHQYQWMILPVMMQSQRRNKDLPLQVLILTPCQAPTKSSVLRLRMLMTLLLVDSNASHLGKWIIAKATKPPWKQSKHWTKNDGTQQPELQRKVSLIQLLQRASRARKHRQRKHLVRRGNRRNRGTLMLRSERSELS